MEATLTPEVTRVQTATETRHARAADLQAILNRYASTIIFVMKLSN